MTLFGLSESLLTALADAEDAVSRLDERARGCAFRAGWMRRQDFSEAVAWGWHSGHTTSVEELLLHDEHMDLQMPSADLVAAHGLVRARRKALAGRAELLSPAGAAWLTGRSRRPPGAMERRRPARAAADGEAPLFEQWAGWLAQVERGATEDAQPAVEEWLAVLALEGIRASRLLQAAFALEGWRIIAPYPRETWLGPLLVAQWLRTSGRTPNHLPGLETGVREMRRRDIGWLSGSLEQRIHGWVLVIAAAARQGVEDLKRLELARQAALRKVGERRGHSHLPALLDLFLERPLVTAPAAAARLKVSGQTARRLIGELGGAVTEVTGQARYRAWRL